jgi:hypothetical protein
MMLQQSLMDNTALNLMKQPSIMQPNFVLQDMPQQNMMPSYQGGIETSVLQLNLNIVGNKLKATNNCCYNITFMLGICLIFPLFFMCCMWWKRIVNPLYELSVSAYQNMANLIGKAPNLNNLTLTIVDNAFNA